MENVPFPRDYSELINQVSFLFALLLNTKLATTNIELCKAKALVDMMHEKNTGKTSS